MNISVKTKKLQKTCSQSKSAMKELGAQGGSKLMQRMMELSAAESLSDISHLPPARCHELKASKKGQFSVDLQHPYRLLFIPSDEPSALKDDGGIDLKNVKEIEIISIEDTH